MVSMTRGTWINSIMLNVILNVILNLFQDLSADMNKKGSRWDAETSSAWLHTMNCHPELVSGSVRRDRQERLAVRCWNLRLSKSRVKLAWTMPSVSKLNNVKQVQDDHQLCSVVFCYIEELVFLLTFMFLRLDMARRWHWYDRRSQICEL